MPNEIAMPFRLAPGGTVAVTASPDEQVRQHVMSLVNTEPGERVVLGDYGVPLAGVLFDPDDVDFVASQVSTDVQSGLATYEPGVLLQSVTGDSGNHEDGLVGLTVHYERADAPGSTAVSRNSNVAFISANGSVSEVIRG